MNPLEPKPWGPLPEDPAERETECARRAGYHAAKAWLDPERLDMYRYGYRYYNARSNGLYEASAPAVVARIEETVKFEHDEKTRTEIAEALSQAVSGELTLDEALRYAVTSSVVPLLPKIEKFGAAILLLEEKGRSPERSRTARRLVEALQDGFKNGALESFRRLDPEEMFQKLDSLAGLPPGVLRAATPIAAAARGLAWAVVAATWGRRYADTAWKWWHHTWSNPEPIVPPEFTESPPIGRALVVFVAASDAQGADGLPPPYAIIKTEVTGAQTREHAQFLAVTMLWGAEAWVIHREQLSHVHVSPQIHPVWSGTIAVHALTQEPGGGESQGIPETPADPREVQ